MSETATETRTLSGPEGIAKIAELIKGIHICMMTTAAGDGSFDSRPMGVQKAEFDGTIWFLTRADSGKIHEIKDDDHIALLFADTSNSKYVSAKGRAAISHDKAKIHELWNPMFKAWFPEGEGDPEIRVLAVRVAEAHYWEANASKLIVGIKYLAAAVTGGKVNVGTQGEVKL
jgi:general stress protein 26